MAKQLGWAPQVEPVFIFSCIRSGSTLLRCILNSHPRICAPHELHLGYLAVSLQSEYLEQSIRTLGLEVDHLRWMLVDRLYLELLNRSKKQILVDKSPSNLWIWSQIFVVWPNARVIILRRNPAMIVRSITEIGDGRTSDDAAALTTRAIQEMDELERNFERSHMITYEELTINPETTLRQLCAFLNVEYVAEMLQYGNVDSGPFIYGIGDWGERIASGTIGVCRPMETGIERWPELARQARRWGY